MGRSFKKHNVKKTVDNFRFNRKGDGAPSVGIRVGVAKTDQTGADRWAEGTVLDGSGPMFQRLDNIAMLLAPMTGCTAGKNLITHKLEACYADLEHSLGLMEREKQAAQPAPLQRAPIHSVDASTYEGNDLGPIGMGDWVTRKGQTARFTVVGLKVSPSTGTILLKTNEPKTRYTDVARFEHARALPPEPVAPAAALPADIDPGLMAVIAQTVAAYKASQQ